MAKLNTCEICFEKVQSFCIQIECVVCQMICSGLALPYSRFDNDDDYECIIMEGVVNDKSHMNEMSNKLFCPFEINQEIETPLTEMDPDMQFYSKCHYIKNINCDYYPKETFNEEIKDRSTTGTNLSLLTITSKFCRNRLWWTCDFLNVSWWLFFFIGLTEMVGWKQACTNITIWKFSAL